MSLHNMSLCVMNPNDTNEQKVDKFSLKLLGIGRYDLTDEEILECISKYVEPRQMESLLFDSFNNYYVLFLNDLDATCRLVGKKISAKSYCFRMLPLLQCFVIDNVYPCVKNEDLRDIFGNFGKVFSVSNHRVVPNSNKFSHVLSGKREVTFLLPGDLVDIPMPINVVHPPYNFNVKKFCCACLTEGHSLLKCPDIEDDKQTEQKNIPEIKFNESDSDSELDALIKSEDIDFEDAKVDDSLPATQPSAETLKKKDGQGVAIVSPQKEIRPDEPMPDVSQEDKPLESKPTTDNLTEVVSTSKVCRFIAGMDLTVKPEKRPVVKRTDALLPPLAEELINEVCGPHIIEANVFKQLVLTDGRLKTTIIEFTYSYLEDLRPLLKILKKVMKQCATEKYSCLRGPFTSKVKRIHSVLLDHRKKK